MKHFYLVGTFILMTVLSSVVAQLIIVKPSRERVEELINNLHSDYMPQQRAEKIYEEISKPEYLPLLWTKFEEEYLHPLMGQRRNSGALSGLQFQRQMTSEQINVITNELKKTPVKSITMDDGSQGYAMTVMAILSKYPSEEHEQIVLSYIDRDRTAMLESVVASLSCIGTSASLPSLERVAAELRSMKRPFVSISDLEATIQAIKQRESEKGKSSAASDNPVDTRTFSVPQQPSKVKTPSNAANASQEPTDYTWLPWLLAVIAAFVSLWFLARHSKR